MESMQLEALQLCASRQPHHCVFGWALVPCALAALFVASVTIMSSVVSAARQAIGMLSARLAPLGDDEETKLTGWEIWALISVQVFSMASKMVMVS